MDTVTHGDTESLRAALRGTLLEPNEAGYDAARSVWNAMIDRRPAIIVRCAGPADVVTALAFARERGMALAVRGGGHNIAGSAVCDGAMVIDLSCMRAVHVDPQRRRAWVEAGATLNDFDHEAQAYGLATPLGINSTTGVAGLTLGGGFGWLSRTLGLTVDSLRGADVVLADGQRVHASATEHADLFWALRGGGGNFGIVTRFEFQLHQVGPEVTAGLMVFPMAQAKTVLARYRDAVADLPDDVTVWAVLRKAPPLPFLAPEWHGSDILALAFFSPASAQAAEPTLARLRGFGTAIGEHIGALPYVAWQQAFDPLLTPGARNYWKSLNFTALGDPVIDVVIDHAGRLPGPQCEIFLALLGARASAPAGGAMAYPHRQALFTLNVHTRWEQAEAADDARYIAWARGFFGAVAPYAGGGVYVNFLTEDEPDRIAEAYGDNYARLRQVKRAYDPGNLFRNNLNIRPAG